VAEVVLAYCASHAPMMSSARMAAPQEQRDNFFGALTHVRTAAVERGAEVCVVLSNEHFTNFFLENFPQICVGLGEKNWGPTEEWLPIDKVWIPGHPGLGRHITEHTLASGFDPAFSHQLELDHGIMTVYHELDPDMRLPLVPIVQNCAVAPLMPLRRAYEFGIALGEAIRSYRGVQRVALVGAGGLSHFIGNPRVGDVEEGFDRWFLDRLQRGEIDEIVDMPDSEVELAGNGSHEIRSWLAVAGAMAPLHATTLAYEPVQPWITGMGVAVWDKEEIP
jgi:Catalytic LigB subunit of aromatic ring-opening dioxygenase